MNSPVTLADLHAARLRIAPHVVRTPLSPSYLLSRQTGCTLWLKQENRQHTGSFKPRGALNKLMSLSEDERRRGIVAASAGNHALGVAYACRALGVERADVFVQATAAPAKIAKLREYPARLRLVGATYDEAQQAALEHVRKTGAVFVSAYDDPAVIAGQGSCGLEIVEDLAGIQAVVVPVGGGALIAGIALAVKSANPQTRIIGVNPAASPSALLSFQRGYAIDPYAHEPTLAHGLAGGYGKAPFAVARDLIDDIVLVTEDEMKQAIVALIDSDQILAEASGVAGLAAVLFRKTELSGNVVVVISGGNIDSDTLRMILSEGVNESASNQRISPWPGTLDTAAVAGEPGEQQRMGSRPPAPAPLSGTGESTQQERMVSRPPHSRPATDNLERPTSPSVARKSGFVSTGHDSVTYQLIGLAMDIHNELGPGHREEAYHNALVVKLKQTDLRFLDEPEVFVQLNDGSDIQKYIPDLIIEETILVELKAQTWPMTRDDMAQVFDYFAATECQQALFFNFGRPRLEHHRLFPPKHIVASRRRKVRGSSGKRRDK